MDALPQPGNLVTEETFGEYQAAQRSYREDAIGDARRDARIWRRLGVGGLLVGAMGVLAAAGIIARHQEHWGFLAYNESTGYVGVVKDIHGVALTLPTPVEDYFAKEHVRMRESWDRVSAAAYLGGASCLLRSQADREQLDRWFNHDPTAPNQVAAATRGDYSRTVTILSEPVVDAVLPNGVRHVSVHFAYRDNVGTTQGQPVLVTDYFNIRRDKAAMNDCDPAGVVISHFVRQPEPKAKP